MTRSSWSVAPVMELLGSLVHRDQTVILSELKCLRCVSSSLLVILWVGSTPRP